VSNDGKNDNSTLINLVVKVGSKCDDFKGKVAQKQVENLANLVAEQSEGELPVPGLVDDTLVPLLDSLPNIGQQLFVWQPLLVIQEHLRTAFENSAKNIMNEGSCQLMLQSLKNLKAVEAMLQTKEMEFDPTLLTAWATRVINVAEGHAAYMAGKTKASTSTFSKASDEKLEGPRILKIRMSQTDLNGKTSTGAYACRHDLVQRFMEGGVLNTST
jgi:hypothetical protein